MRSSSAPSRKQHHPSSTSPSSGGSVRAQAQDSSTQSACSCTVHKSCTCTECRHKVQPNGIHFPTRKTSAAQGNGCSLLTPLLCPFCLRDPMLSAGTCTANQQSVAEDSFRIVYRTARVPLPLEKTEMAPQKPANTWCVTHTQGDRQFVTRAQRRGYRMP